MENMECKKPGIYILGPAWHSCGSHQLFKCQIDSYAAMGFDTYFLAISPSPHILGKNNGFWDHYLQMTPDIRATVRGEAKLSRVFNFNPAVILERIRGLNRTVCFFRTLPARFAELPMSHYQFAESHEIKLIHCNHYFNLPIAIKIKQLTGATKIVCETQDIQSRHLIETEPKHPLTGLVGNYDAYFEDELRCCEDSDEFIHLNEEENHVFARALPHKKHHLIYPSVARPAKNLTDKPDIDFLIVSSANWPNYNSLCWFLDEVWDDEINALASLQIIGNVDYMFRDRKDQRYTKFGNIFHGRVEDVAVWYHRARTVVAPVIEGQGISIKTLEALSFGRPFLFSPMALRGFEDRPEIRKLTGMCRTASEFKQALRDRLVSAKNSIHQETDKSALYVYNSLFTPEIYRKRIQDLVYSH